MGAHKNRRLALVLGIAVWLLAFCLSLALAIGTDPTGSGFTRGMNRVGTFFRWQFLAFACAILVWLNAKGREDLSSGLRLLARVPIFVQCLLGLAGVVVVVLAIVFK